MFEQLVVETREADDASLVDSMTSATQAEAQNAARRLAAIAELTHRRCTDHQDRDLWACDGWDAAASEIGAALTINRWQAASQMHLALTLRDRLPQVGALLSPNNSSTATAPHPSETAQPSGTFCSISSSQIRADMSDGARQSPRGDRAPPADTFGPFGSADRLNWLNE